MAERGQRDVPQTSGSTSGRRPRTASTSCRASTTQPVATIISPLERHIGRRSSSRPNLIVNWVHRLEKLNANLDDPQETGGGGSSEQKTNNTRSKSQGPNQQQQQQQQRHQIVTIIGSNQPEVGDDDDEEAKELCFKAAQLVTEFLLMVFAASLLIIATIVVFSKKIPAFMESYEIVPKILFFLCVFVAIYSFMRWLLSKIAKRFGLFTKFFGTNQDEKDEAGTKQTLDKDNKTKQRADEERETCHESARDQSERRKLLETGHVHVSTATDQVNESSSRAPLLSSSSLMSSTASLVQKQRQQQRSNYDRLTGTPATAWPGSCQPVPIRQGPFDANDLLAEEAEPAINEENSDRELSCASA